MPKSLTNWLESSIKDTERLSNIKWHLLMTLKLALEVSIYFLVGTLILFLMYSWWNYVIINSITLIFTNAVYHKQFEYYI